MLHCFSPLPPLARARLGPELAPPTLNIRVDDSADFRPGVPSIDSVLPAPPTQNGASIVHAHSRLRVRRGRRQEGGGGAPPNAIVEYVTNLVMPVSDACIALATDVVGLSLAVPNALVDLFVYAIDKAREMPDLAMNVKNGDGKTLDDLSSFAADMASIVFCVYAEACRRSTSRSRRPSRSRTTSSTTWSSRPRSRSSTSSSRVPS